MSRLSFFFKRLVRMDWKAMWATTGLLKERSDKSRPWLLCDMLYCALKYNAGYVDYKIAQMYDRFRQTEKDDLLTEVKAKRKAFIQQIAVKLKPMGFKKKSNNWTRPVEDDCSLVFEAQKSSFSDEYYFNVYIGKNGTNHFRVCYYTRVFPGEMCPMDWQALSKDEFEVFLNHTVVPALERIISTPLHELGKFPSIWSCCSCDRKKCERCWVEKNLWEAKNS